MDAVKLTEQLIKIKSISGNEKEIGEFIYDLVKDMGFKVRKQKVGESFNIIATAGKPVKILNAHMDTVPPYIPFKRKGNVIYGRGACDTKGSIAAMLVAGEKLLHYVDDFGLVFTVREETDFAGAIAASKKVKPKFFIVGEPTDNKCVFGQKGIIDVVMQFRGKSAHSSMPELGENAIMKMNDAIDKLKRIRLAEGEYCNVGVVKGGVASNIIPNHAEMHVSFRTVKSNDRIIKSIKKIGSLRIISNIPPVKMDKFIECKNSIDFYPAFTEMHFWAKHGKGIILGPGSLKDAHSKNEKVNIRELREVPKIYENLISKFERY